MRAAWYEKNGPAAEVLRVGEMPVPEPGPGEVRVRVVASGLNPTDVKSRAGSRPMGFPRVVPHQDGAGVIDAVGPGVPAARVGERVWMFIVQFQRPWGTAAEFTVVPAKLAVTLPRATGFAEGACLGIPAVTAHRCLFADGPVAGQTVLVTGGAGAVGHYAVQLAKWGGARVIATVSSPAKAARAAAAGADHTVNYRTGDPAAEILALTGGAGVDRIVDVDFGGNLATSLKVVKVNGTIAAYASMGDAEPKLPFYALMTRNVTVRPVLIYTMPERAKDDAAADVVRLVEAGRLQHQIGARFPLARIVEAHEAQESGQVIGNIVVDVAPE
ncbi:MAG: NADPH:quinone reductase [Candidatus Rokubacteria bacterium]|nr:NADPH:quinone reductase [Candidatus Rokubacteria bacterium]